MILEEFTEKELNLIDTLVRNFENVNYIEYSNNILSEKSYEALNELCSSIMQKIEV